MPFRKPAYLIMFLGTCLFLSCDRNIHVKNPVPVIFDTDIGPDYDDVGAMAMLHAMADSGECRILATMASNGHPRIVPVLDILNRYFNRPGIPIGIVRPAVVNLGARQHWDSLLVARYPHVMKDNSEADDAVSLYRKLLAAEPDTSVTIVTVGFFTNMARLLESGGDASSPLNGKDLVNKKVKLLVSMAGRFDSAMGKFREFNVVQDSISSKKVFDEWPRPIVFSGFEIGMHIHTGLPITQNDSIHGSPVKDVFAWSIPRDPEDRGGRMSWDETAVLVAVRGHEKYFDLVPGKIIGYANGANGWDSSGTRDRYLVTKIPVQEMENVLNGLIMHQPAHK